MTGAALPNLHAEATKILQTGHFVGTALEYGRRLPQIMVKLITRLRDEPCGLGRDWQTGGFYKGPSTIIRGGKIG